LTAKSHRAENRAKQRAAIVTAWHIFEECFDCKDTRKHTKLHVCFCEIVKTHTKLDKVSLPGLYLPFQLQRTSLHSTYYTINKLRNVFPPLIGSKLAQTAHNAILY